jgi:hypothetical protein
VSGIAAWCEIVVKAVRGSGDDFRLVHRERAETHPATRGVTFGFENASADFDAHRAGACNRRHPPQRAFAQASVGEEGFNAAECVYG